MQDINLRFRKMPTSSGLSLRDQICEAISFAISSKTVAYNRPLPSCRQLAQQFNVSRNTVFAAYSRLIDLGLLVSRDRSGYYVHPDAQSLLARSSKKFDADGAADEPPPIVFGPSNLLPIENPADWYKYPYPFLYNQIDPNLFPIDGWRECSRQILGRKKFTSWANDSVETDSPQLVQQLRQRLLGYRGIYAEDDEILVTLGAQNALSLISLVLAGRKKPIAVEDPGFQGARNAFRLAGHKLTGVRVDKNGLVVSEIPKNCQMVFTTPSHHFPTMVTMSQDRRAELLDAAVRSDFLILEDDYEAEMNYFNQPAAPLKSLDETGRVIYIGSLSKTISPGIRLGFMVAHRDIIRQARIIRGTMLRHPPTIIQETAALFLQLGYYDSHLRNIERRYKTRWHTMRDAIVRHLGMLDMTKNLGGTCFWLTGPEGFDATELSSRLKTRGVLVDKGQTFYLNNDDKRSFRTGFAYVPVTNLEEGVKIIAEETEKLL